MRPLYRDIYNTLQYLDMSIKDKSNFSPLQKYQWKLILDFDINVYIWLLNNKYIEEQVTKDRIEKIDYNGGQQNIRKEKDTVIKYSLTNLSNIFMNNYKHRSFKLNCYSEDYRLIDRIVFLLLWAILTYITT